MSSRLFSALAMVVVIVSSCREPTSVFVEVFTNVPHRDGLATAFTVGAPGATEAAEPTTETRAPFGSGGFVGSLAVVPATSDDATLSVKVVLGVQKDVRDCRPPDYAGCIVARRTLRYRPNVEQTLPIHLHARCEGIPCTPGTTCNENGECVPAEVGATASADAGTPGTNDAGPTPIGRSVDCPGPESPCTGSKGCCWNDPGTPGNCVTVCGGNVNAFLQCDGPEDCLPSTNVCCVSTGIERASCRPACGSTEIELCHGTARCTGSKACTAIYRGHFRACQ